MNPITKLHFGSAGYCAALMSLNWFRSIEYSRSSGLTFESFSAVSGAVVLSGIVALLIGWHCLRAARAALEQGARIADGRWIPVRSVAFYAVPLLFHRTTGSSWIESDGARAVSIGGYGHELSFLVFAFAVAGMFLFQILMRLNGDQKAAEPGATDNPDDAQRV